ncbi:UNVERIFIED_CONTAM: hypothetical protein Slati_0933900 [Sesamum latifolium]|uniref:DUF4216 domain-containing protein n=1 Tax=Sesamum latifolium TaxID=2727402 RepID=A0AAW2XPH0_9LAMI
MRIYFKLCRANGASKKRWLSGSEHHIIETYILCNFEVVTLSFLNELYEHHHLEDPNIDVATKFKDWFKRSVKSELNYTDNELLKLHYCGPILEVTTFPCYFVNGYNFRTGHHSIGKSTMNHGMCVKSLLYTDTDNNFYAILKEIIQLDYSLIPNMHIILFKCYWVDPVRGTSRSTNGESDDEYDEDSFDEDYETEEENNYD